MLKKSTKNNEKPHKSLRVLFADDEVSLQEMISLELPRYGYEVNVCPDGITALAVLERESFDCMIVDLDMPGMYGTEVMKKAKEIYPDLEVIIMTGKSSTDSAISAVKHGAFDYLTKPCKLVELDKILTKVANTCEQKRKIQALQRQLERAEGKREMVGKSSGIQTLRSLISRVAPTNSTVMILGETGTGKELVARAIHQQSHRAEMPFVAINCGALPESLIESELFGHRKGAFTGADDHRAGLFEMAHGGTIFLDEIGELPKSMQAKMLRVLESREVRRVGENTSTPVDVRVVCATHRNLFQMVQAGDFREDLMYRINTFEVHVPALRDRLEDLAELVNHLVERFRPGLQRTGNPVCTENALHLLRSHSWPGNVRELANVIEHALILCDQLPIDVIHLPRYFPRGTPATPRWSLGAVTLDQLELMAIEAALERHQGNKALAAEELGISLKTLYNKMPQVNPLSKTA